MHLDLVVVERSPQVLLDPDPTCRPGAHVVVEDFVAILAELLCLVHRGVGVPDQFLGRAHARSEGDADAGRDGEGLAEPADGRADRRLDPGRDPGDLVGVGEVLAQDHELVPTQSRHRVARSHDVRQPAGDLDQQRVAGRMPVGVIDRLETVQVAEQYGERAIARPSGEPRQGRLDPVQQHGPVRQIGKAVVERLPGQPLLGDPAGGDVLDLEQDAAALHGVGELGHGQQRPQLGAVGPDQPSLARQAGPPLGERPAAQGGQRPTVLRHGQLQDVGQRQQRGLIAAEQPAQGRVDLQRPTLR